jgi:LysM repeat protein
MEDDEIETSSGGGLVPIALALLAIVLGGAGLYFGLNASQRLNPLAESMDAGSTSVVRLEKDIRALETQLAEISARNTELEKALGRVRLYSNQSEQAVKQLASSVRENRGEIVDLADRINKVVTRAPGPAPTASESTRTELPGAAPASQAEARPGPPAEEEGYTVVAGDTFARIAGKLEVGLQALLDANPGVDPRRLRIGQVINVPGN